MASPSHAPCASFSGIFSPFFRAGFPSPGAGNALIPRLEADLVAQRSWLSPGDCRDTVAVAECSPANVGSPLPSPRRSGVSPFLFAATAVGVSRFRFRPAFLLCPSAVAGVLLP